MAILEAVANIDKRLIENINQMVGQNQLANLTELLKKVPPFSPADLGSKEFRNKYNLKYAYLAGAMYKGIGSKEVVISMGKAGFLAFLGTGGMRFEQIETDILEIKKALGQGQSFGLNLLCNLVNPIVEEQTVDLYLKHEIKMVDAAAYSQITAALVRYRIKGLKANPDGSVNIGHSVFGKVSRPEVANQFLSPAPERIVAQLLASGKITAEEAQLAEKVPVVDALIVEADSGGHTDKAVSLVLTPAMLRIRDDAMKQYGYTQKIYVGAAGGLGSPEAIAAAFLMGVDFVQTGSINQCTVEAGQSDLAKDLLADAGIQDMDMAPAGDMFEIGARVQVLKKGLFFSARANKLYELYKQYESLDQIDLKTRNQIETKYFKKTFDEVWQETKNYYATKAPDVLAKAEQIPKQKMSLILRWYFVNSTRLAMKGIADGKVDFQIHSGPAMGAFNQWVKGTRLENWHNRHVGEMGDLLMQGATKIFKARFLNFCGIQLPDEYFRLEA